MSLEMLRALKEQYERELIMAEAKVSVINDIMCRFDEPKPCTEIPVEDVSEEVAEPTILDIENY